MRCPSCGFENQLDARLCRDCGLSLYIDCPSCGHENSADRSLCSNCWHQLRDVTPEGSFVGEGIPAFDYGRPAGFWIRFVASIIDGIPLTLVSALLAWLLFGENLFDTFTVETDAEGNVIEGGGFTGGQGLNLILSAAYATAFVSMLGGTLGILLLRMRVLRPDGSMLGPGRAFARYAVLTLTFALFLVPAIISAFMVGMRKDRRGIHDLICDTVVVIRE